MLKIPNVKIILLAYATLFLSCMAPVSAQAKPEPNRTPLFEKKLTLPNPNIDVKVVRVAFPYGFKTPWHTHEGPGPRYIVKGTLKVSQHGKTGTYSAGEVFWETGELMAVENVGDEAAELIIFELAPNKQ